MREKLYSGNHVYIACTRVGFGGKINFKKFKFPFIQGSRSSLLDEEYIKSSISYGLLLTLPHKFAMATVKLLTRKLTAVGKLTEGTFHVVRLII